MSPRAGRKIEATSSSPHRLHSHTVLARGRFFSRARKRLPARGERSRRRGMYYVYRPVPIPRFAISTFTARYGRYISVHQVVGTRTTRYRAVLSKIDRRRSIEGRNRSLAVD
ncbi:hypothetical protein BHE74_00044898 [Ensete ventricosum]|nr:hypothetical protein GW17_00039478 [Ensete ventricosum]RWW48985.1 hypothetical protein BHE74_00044898 [Ensete ventricosum]